MPEPSTPTLDKLFGQNLFSDACMQKYLPEEAYKTYRLILQNSAPMSPVLADQMAAAMKTWATERGATHFTHWFQPLSGVTAEKHEAFLEYSPKGEIETQLSGRALVQGESDASSFPSGGLRATFEARGYTTWDYTSPAFLKEDSSGVTLCIPTAFRSYTGEALDDKTPLLRAMNALNQQLLRLLRLSGDFSTQRVHLMIGAEQEYFLIDRALFDRRMDMVFCGRTLFGARPGKSQEMEGHYYGAIKERIAEYMRELDEQLWKMGVPAKTRHSEAAPAQHELAPLFNEGNVACDQNQLIMETMQRVAGHHNLACLLSSKPFSYINGSGKHINWSLQTDTGRNLFSPGRTPTENRLFLTMICAVVSALDRHANLLRYACASRDNDLRLGACEAPPAIISLCLGEPLTQMLEEMEHTGLLPDADVAPKTLIHDSDRNRTSPFAFTGNRFEFRMLSSSMSVNLVSVVLSTIMAEAIDDICTKLEVSLDPKTALREILIDLWKNHKRVVFNGNGYEDAWYKTAEALGLGRLNDTFDALPSIKTPEAVKLFETYNVFTASELSARFEIKQEEYLQAMLLEASTMLEMVDREILPACMTYQGQLARAGLAVSELTGAQPVQLRVVRELSTYMEKAAEDFERLKTRMEQGKALTVAERVKLYRDELIPIMSDLRADCDALERMVPDTHWPLPTYNELLFNI